MDEQQTSTPTAGQLHQTGTEALEAAQAQQAGVAFEWHYGRVTRVGHSEVAGGDTVTIIWEEGGVSAQQGTLSDGQWEIF